MFMSRRYIGFIKMLAGPFKLARNMQESRLENRIIIIL